MIFIQVLLQPHAAELQQFVDHMGFGPAGCPLHHQLDVYHGLADDKAVIDYGFHGVVQHVDESILNELETMMDDESEHKGIYDLWL